MTSDVGNLIKPVEANDKPCINLPNGKTIGISHVGDVSLENNLNLKKVLCVPSFRHNLLSVNKLVQHDGCNVTFYPNYCIIQDSVTQTIKCVGKAQGGLYYLVNVPLKRLHQ